MKFMMPTKVNSFIYGGDYNPEQWFDNPEVIDEDFRLMKLSNVNTLTIGVFSWSELEPVEGEYNFEWLDEIMGRIQRERMFAILATPSGARPPWLAQKYPEVLRVNQDRRRNLYGFRHNHCYTSPVYKEKVRMMNEALAKRYKNHSALILWHVSNEYGGECHCQLCQNAFREWLKKKYKSLDVLNKAWWTKFWSHKYTEWNQIESPSDLGEKKLHGLVLDWKRFVTYQTRSFMEYEMMPLREITPEVPITTNFMGTYDVINYWELIEPLDLVSWDSYPLWHSTSEIETAIETAFIHDIYSSMKKGSPFLLMESTPSMTNWQPVSKLKRPGMNILSSIQAVSHGSDSVQYFQWRKSRGSYEKFHGAVVDHVGHENTRVFKEVAEVGAQLEKIKNIAGSIRNAEVAIIYDWENKWALEECKGINNSKKEYLETIIAHYKAFWEMGINVDVIDMSRELDGYELVIAPMLYMLRADIHKKINHFVDNGGSFVTTYFSGMVNETDLCFLGGFPGPLKDVLGIWIEEHDGLYERDRVELQCNFNKNNTMHYKAKDICSIVHCNTAVSLGEYNSEFYAETPCLTKNRYGKGQAYYIGFRNNETFEKDFYAWLVEEHGISKNLDVLLPIGVTVQKRINNTSEFLFVQNFSNTDVMIQNMEGSYRDVLTNEQIIGKLYIEASSCKILERLKFIP